MKTLVTYTVTTKGVLNLKSFLQLGSEFTLFLCNKLLFGSALTFARFTYSTALLIRAAVMTGVKDTLFRSAVLWWDEYSAKCLMYHRVLMGQLLKCIGAASRCFLCKADVGGRDAGSGQCLLTRRSIADGDSLTRTNAEN